MVLNRENKHQFLTEMKIEKQRLVTERLDREFIRRVFNRREKESFFNRDEK